MKLIKYTGIVLVIAFCLPIAVHSQQSKARAKYVAMSRADVTPGKENGFDFEKVVFKYKFITCEGQVKLGATYDKKAVFTKYWKNGKEVKKENIAPNKWPKPEDVILGDLTADLYFGSRKLGKVKLFAIPDAYRGCGGKTYEILRLAGVDPYEGVYKTNIEKLNLRNIRVTKASVKKDS